MLEYVKRTTVMLDDDVDARLRNEAARRGLTVSQVTREAIEAHVLGGPRRGRRLGAAGAGRSGRSDVSERIEEILRLEMGHQTRDLDRDVDHDGEQRASS